MREKEMKLLYVIEHISTVGGLERILVAKLNALAAEPGHEVVLMTVWSDDAPPAFPLDSRVVHVCLGVRRPASALGMMASMPRVIARFNRMAREISPDITVHFRAVGAMLAVFSRRQGRIVFETHSARQHCNHRWLYPLMERRADAVVCLTGADAGNYSRASCVEVIPNFTDMKPVVSAGQRDYGARRCVYSGRLCAEKDPLRLLRLWRNIVASHPDWTLDIYGTGELESEVIAEVEALGISSSVTMHGNVADMAAAYGHGSILLLTSRTEGFPLAIIEAMRCGMPVVSMDCPYGPAEIIRDGVNGFLVPQTDEAAFVHCVSSLMDSEALRQRMGMQAASDSTRYSADAVIGRWKTFFREVAAGGRPCHCPGGRSPRILLLGEYSNVHWTLAEALRSLGCDVTVASGGDAWKGYRRDVDLSHRLTLWGHVSFAFRLLLALPRMRGYDIVQLINPVFFEMRPALHRFIFDYLRRSNRVLVLGAFGMDYYWVQVNRDIRPMRYSDSNMGGEPRTDAVARKDMEIWIGTDAERLCRHVACASDAIVAGLYEYWVTYGLAEGGCLKGRTVFIPFPVAVAKDGCSMPQVLRQDAPLRIFVGISKGRSQYKGTDIMMRAAERLRHDYPDKVELLVAEGVPFAEYRQMMDGSDVILDQLYSYTPAMNALLAMSKGIVCVGGGEPEHYDLLGEAELRPIVNVEPDEKCVYNALEALVLHPERLPELKRQSMEYVHRHHDPRNVALRYLDLYRRLLLR